MPASSLSPDQARSGQVATQVATVWRDYWENRTRLDVRNSSSWRPLHSYTDCMMASLPATQCQSGVVASMPSTKCQNHKEQQLRSPIQDGAANGNDARQPMVEGELPSIGSEGHFEGSCKRCAFFPKGRCLNGKDCTHCHFPHDPRPRNRKRRVTKSQRCEDEESPEEFSVYDDGAIEDAYSSEVMLSSPDEDEGPGAVEFSEVAFSRLVTISESEGVFQGEVATKQNTNEDADREAFRKAADASTEDVSTIDEDGDAPVECARSDATDADKESISSLCEGERSEKDSASTQVPASKGTPSETSDSEVSPLLDSSSALEGAKDQAKDHSLTKKNMFACPSPTSWAAVRRNKEAVDITRMTRALLNKLTEERFESLCTQILALPLSTPEQLALVVKEIFHKATTQGGFRALYTELCLRLDAHLTAQTGIIGGKAFRKALVNECQATFEHNLNPPDASRGTNLNDDEAFELAMKLKNGILGNLRFIGDLLVRRLLSAKLLGPIVHELLHGNEAALESLLALLEVVSPEFDGKPSLYQAPLHDAFAALRRKVAEKSTCSRVRYQIQNLLDARARGWAARCAAC